jgi:hypothetical protein
MQLACLPVMHPWRMGMAATHAKQWGIYSKR